MACMAGAVCQGCSKEVVRMALGLQKEGLACLCRTLVLPCARRGGGSVSVCVWALAALVAGG